MIRYLDRGCERQISLAFYRENLDDMPGLREEILRCIRNGKVDDAASPALRDARLKLADTTRAVIAAGLELLGVTAPEKM